MATKKIYFVRHGETEMNNKSRHQHPAEPLTEAGKKQAKEAAKFFKVRGIEAIVTSPYTRALETATIIGEELDLPISEDDSLVEFRRPDRLYGHKHHSVGSFWYLLKLFLHREDNSWNNDNAENIFDVRNRILDTKKLLTGMSEKNIVVVSHAIYIDMFAAAVCADRSLHLKEFISVLVGAKRLPNCGVVAFEADDLAPPETCSWHLVTEDTDNYYLRWR